MDSRTPAALFTFADLLVYKAILAPESYTPIPQLGIRDPASGEHLGEVILVSPLAETMEVETLYLSLRDAIEEARQRGEYWLEKREKEWKEELRVYFGLIPPQ
ncbi:hypothetical protein RHMOL_Rhmol10G0200300 [Rhododendron molle]|uniref:Uncharacterized protein n=1 Tax=Rhododendron molle TaxID=49168 RepID=A0ACC0M5U5_RHOML|nr:hypothetical protein RHMOL_Rhmol10G0200300 [Rhododendron molle]